MASSETGLYSKLTGTAGVTALISARVYAITMPQNATLPAAVYYRVGTPRYRDLDGPDAIETPLFQITCWADDPAEAKAVADAIRTAIDGDSGTWGTCTIRECAVEDEGYLEDISQGNEAARLYGYRLDVRISHEES